MNFIQILSLLAPLAPMAEKILADLEANTIQPEVKKLLATLNPNSDLALLLTFLDTAIDAFVQAEIGKLAVKS